MSNSAFCLFQLPKYSPSGTHITVPGIRTRTCVYYYDGLQVLKGKAYRRITGEDKTMKHYLPFLEYS